MCFEKIPHVVEAYMCHVQIENATLHDLFKDKTEIFLLLHIRLTFFTDMNM
jgi:hypothetical protein